MKCILYGHLFVDRIISDFKEKTTLGGIANVWSGLKQLNQNLTIGLKPTSIGEAIILVDKENNQRVSRGIHNLKTCSPTIESADWNHIAYINQIEDLTFINQIDQGIISADLTKERPENVLDFLGVIDYLFISREDLFMDIEELGKKVKGWLIVHDPQGSTCTNGKKLFEYKLPNNLFLTNVNVLGAGDFFAAGFINQKLGGNDENTSIEKAHESTTKLLNENLI